MRFQNRMKYRLFTAILLRLLLMVPTTEAQQEPSDQHGSPVPLLSAGHPVDWWFVFKLNAKTFPGCGDAVRNCSFGGKVQVGGKYKAFSQQFVYASEEDKTLQKGTDCLGNTTTDPVGATFDEIYNGSFFYVIWNDQFYGDPKIAGCGSSCGGPWGHSKGVLAWDADGEGLVMQVTTPSWPASGSAQHPRITDGNTLGCLAKDNDIEVSQHFFALKLSKSDVITVLHALENASVVTDPLNPQIVNSGGPDEIQAEVKKLGVRVPNTAFTFEKLSSGVELISKPSALHVPPWQMVSSILGGVSLRTATWWTKPAIPQTAAETEVGCWDDSLAKPGPVDIAAHGVWDSVTIGLEGGLGQDRNHAKIGVSASDREHLSIFGDMNQQGALSFTKNEKKECSSSQNGRGGLFYVVDDQTLTEGIQALLQGDSPTIGMLPASAGSGH